MFRRVWILTVLTALLTPVVPSLMAQGGGMNRSMSQAGQLPADVVEIQGVVESVTMGFGQGMPSFILAVPGRGKITVMVGPYRAWTDSAFELKAGMTVMVRAFASATRPDTYVAVEIKDPASGASVQLSAGGGRGRRGGPGTGERPCGGIGPQLDLANGRTFDGTVIDVEMEPGKGLPTFTLDTGKGERVTILASPYRALVDAGFTITSGDEVSVVAYPSANHDDAYVAAKITNLTTRKELVLRDDKGLPAGGFGRAAGGCAGVAPSRSRNASPPPLPAQGESPRSRGVQLAAGRAGCCDARVRP